jgi:hypothetical protein
LSFRQKQRLSNAKYDPTYLMADVEVVATYKLANIHPIKLEKIIHKFFTSANIDIEVKDRFRKLVKSQEWFLVPFFIIDEMVEKIKDGTGTNLKHINLTVNPLKHPNNKLTR